MNRQEWLEMKKANQYTNSVFYDFFKIHNKGRDMSEDEFQKSFNIYVHYKGMVPLQKIIEYYDDRFAIVKLFDKNNQLIKEY